jgi:hypothetical protein
MRAYISLQVHDFLLLARGDAYSATQSLTIDYSLPNKCFHSFYLPVHYLVQFLQPDSHLSSTSHTVPHSPVASPAPFGRPVHVLWRFPSHSSSSSWQFLSEAVCCASAVKTPFSPSTTAASFACLLALAEGVEATVAAVFCFLVTLELQDSAKHKGRFALLQLFGALPYQIQQCTAILVQSISSETFHGSPGGVTRYQKVSEVLVRVILPQQNLAFTAIVCSFSLNYFHFFAPNLFSYFDVQAPFA